MPEAPKTVEAKAEHISIVDTNTLVVSGEPAVALANALVRHNEHVLRELQDDAPSINLSDIYIDADGNIQIENEEFLRIVRERISPTDPAIQAIVENGICNLLCKLF